jgi:lipopolysaccharide export system permease protein
MFAEFARLEARYVKGEESQISVQINGLWLRQGDVNRQSVIHAQRVAQQGERLSDVMVLLYGPNDKFLGRVDARAATLHAHYWELTNAWVSDAKGGKPEHRDTYRLPTTLTPQQIQESFAAPDTQSFWDLPGYIRAAQAAGFSATRYQLYLYSLYALPALFAAMVFMAASFSLRIGPSGGAAKVALFSAAAGFGVYFFQDLTTVLGRSGAVPTLLAATAPALAAILIGMTLVFSQEDG